MEPLAFVELFLQVSQKGLPSATANRYTKQVQQKYFHSTNVFSGFVFNSEHLQMISCIVKMQNKQCWTVLLGSPAEMQGFYQVFS